MKFWECVELIEQLAKSQGFYCRLLNALDTMEDDILEQLAIEWEEQNFQSPVDFILYLEG